MVTPKLTVDLGLRWEFYPPGTPHFAGGFSNYDPAANALVIAGVGNNPSNLGMATRYNYFAPQNRRRLPSHQFDCPSRWIRNQLHSVSRQ